MIVKYIKYTMKSESNFCDVISFGKPAMMRDLNVYQIIDMNINNSFI